VTSNIGFTVSYKKHAAYHSVERKKLKRLGMLSQLRSTLKKSRIKVSKNEKKIWRGKNMGEENSPEGNSLGGILRTAKLGTC